MTVTYLAASTSAAAAAVAGVSASAKGNASARRRMLAANPASSSSPSPMSIRKREDDLGDDGGEGKDGVAFDRQITERSVNGDWKEKSDYDDATCRPVNVPQEQLVLPPLSEPIKDGPGWVRDEDDFIVVYAQNAAYIGSDLKTAPMAR